MIKLLFASIPFVALTMITVSMIRTNKSKRGETIATLVFAGGLTLYLAWVLSFFVG